MAQIFEKMKGDEKYKKRREEFGRYYIWRLRLIARLKNIFGASLGVWLRGELRWMINEYLDESKIRQQGFFDVDTVKATSAQFLEGKISHYRVWVLIVFQMWWERYCSSN